MIEFTAVGAPKVLARTIEQQAQDQGSVSAIVVPWESDSTTLSMAVTSVKVDGWAIEHTNLGTIRLTDLTGDQTRVTFATYEADHPEKQQLAALFDRFAKQIRSRLEVSLNREGGRG